MKKCETLPASQYCNHGWRRGIGYHHRHRILQASRKTWNCVSPSASEYCKLGGRRENSKHHLHLNFASLEEVEELPITTCIAILQAWRNTRNCLSAYVLSLFSRLDVNICADIRASRRQPSPDLIRGILFFHKRKILKFEAKISLNDELVLNLLGIFVRKLTRSGEARKDCAASFFRVRNLFIF